MRLSSEKGDEVASGLIEFAQRYKVASAHFTGNGALKDATGSVDGQRKEKLTPRQKVAI
jgi:predicted DNA-binding protein with PD1-like motif